MAKRQSKPTPDAAAAPTAPVASLADSPAATPASAPPPPDPDAAVTATLDAEEADRRRITLALIGELEYAVVHSHGAVSDRALMSAAARELRGLLDIPTATRISRQGVETPAL